MIPIHRTRPRQRRQALYRSARIAGAIELVPARTQGRSARQLYRLQSRRDANVEPPVLRRQSRRPHRCHQNHAHRPQHYAPISTDNPGSPNLQAGLAKLPVFTTVGGSAGIAHRFNRFELAVKGTAERTAYQELHADRRLDVEQRGPQLQSIWRRAARQLRIQIARREAVRRIQTRAATISKPTIRVIQRNSKGITGQKARPDIPNFAPSHRRVGLAIPSARTMTCSKNSPVRCSDAVRCVLAKTR